MSHAPSNDDEDLKPTMHAGYKPGEKKTVEELAALDAEDESLAKWKASLGITGASGTTSTPTGPQVTVVSLFLASPTLTTPLSLNFTNAAEVAQWKGKPITIKEGVEYNVGITFLVNHGITSGLRYIQVVKRGGIKVDKSEEMLGSYAPSPDGIAYTKKFPDDESPSGLIARSGTYAVRSRVVDDDHQIYLDFEWSFKLSKEW